MPVKGCSFVLGLLLLMYRAYLLRKACTALSMHPSMPLWIACQARFTTASMSRGLLVSCPHLPPSWCVSLSLSTATMGCALLSPIALDRFLMPTFLDELCSFFNFLASLLSPSMHVFALLACASAILAILAEWIMLVTSHSSICCLIS